MATVARDVLTHAMGQGVQTTHRDVTDLAALLEETISSIVTASLTSKQQEMEIAAITASPDQQSIMSMIVRHISQMLCALILHESIGFTAVSITAAGADAWRQAVAHTPKAAWMACVVPYAASVLSSGDGAEDETDSMECPSVSTHQDSLDDMDGPRLPRAQAEAMDLAKRIRVVALNGIPDLEATEEIDTTQYLCNFEFSLAFGGKILLHNTFLKLAKGHKYGIMGKNGVGKTTLMTNIGSGNIDGLPRELRTVYVQHDDPSIVDEGE